ncbi:hypothetical protein PIB30_014448 [Stylosanthes scabra]|uniref:TF-B3 domain-containing protein n=1 Tax=Stylosanthes scabra TaxID=79078 RepID=A0ABU6V698_9FABA|nr:hypothetical protein [Stylosanthes scabra]
MAAALDFNGGFNNNNNTFTFCCFYCKSMTTSFRYGWSLSDGTLAKLCFQCGFLYESGTFCSTFHAGTTGWRQCIICRKHVHCECIASAKDIFMMNNGGVCCIGCAKKYLLPAAEDNTEHKPVNDCPPLLFAWNNSIASQSMDHPFNAMATAANESNQMVMCGAQMEEQTPVIIGGGSSSTAMNDNVNGCCLFVSPQTGLIRFLNYYQMKEQQYLKDLGYPNSSITPMFKKILSATDAKAKSGRLVIPTKGARSHFPELSDDERCKRLEILDITGRIWKLSYRFWENNRGRIYVLGGLKDYITMWKWQVGEQVTFYRIDPEDKYLIVTEKEFPASSS